MHCINVPRLFLYAGAFVCNIISPSFSTIEVSCIFLGKLIRVGVILNCTSCPGEHTFSITDDSPIEVPNLPAGNYTVDIIAMDINNDIIRTVKVIVMSKEVTTDMSPTSGPTTNILTTTTLPATTVSTSAVSIIEVLTTNKATTNKPATESNNKNLVYIATKN